MSNLDGQSPFQQGNQTGSGVLTLTLHVKFLNLIRLSCNETSWPLDNNAFAGPTSAPSFNFGAAPFGTAACGPSPGQNRAAATGQSWAAPTGHVWVPPPSGLFGPPGFPLFGAQPTAATAGAPTQPESAAAAAAQAATASVEEEVDLKLCRCCWKR